MTAAQPTLAEALQAKLAELRAELETAQADLDHPGSTGDAADRSLNVDAVVLVEELRASIAELELQLQQPVTAALAEHLPLGGRVTVRFEEDDSTASYLVAPAGTLGATVAVVTPESPLGRALAGAKPGDRLVYRSDAGADVAVEVVAIEAAPNV